MKIKSNTMQVYSPPEWYVGNLIRDDELFFRMRDKLLPETYIKPELKKLVEIIIEHGNSMEAICKADRVISIYAQTLCNYVLDWTIKSKCKEE